MGSGSTNVLENICDKYEVNLLKRKARKTFPKTFSGCRTDTPQDMVKLSVEEIKEIINKSSTKKIMV